MRQAFKALSPKGLRHYGDLAAEKASELTGDDVLAGTCSMLSVFLRDPQFQGQTKDKLVSYGSAQDGQRQPLEIVLSYGYQQEPDRANWLLEQAIERMEDRKAGAKKKKWAWKTATRKLRLPRQISRLFCSRYISHRAVSGRG